MLNSIFSVYFDFEIIEKFGAGIELFQDKNNKLIKKVKKPELRATMAILNLFIKNKVSNRIYFFSRKV